MQLTELERRVLLDLIDDDNARDRRHFERGRSTREVLDAQNKLYWTIRTKLILHTPVPDA